MMAVKTFKKHRGKAGEKLGVRAELVRKTLRKCLDRRALSPVVSAVIMTGVTGSHMALKEVKDMKSFKNNERAVSTVISSIILIGATVACMMVVIVYCQYEINAYHSMLGENLCIERVKITPTSIWAYVRNNGHGAITLQFLRVNGKAYNFTPPLLLNEGEGDFVTIQGSFGPGAYLLEFVSARWKVFSVEVKHP